MEQDHQIQNNQEKRSQNRRIGWFLFVVFIVLFVFATILALVKNNGL